MVKKVITADNKKNAALFINQINHMRSNITVTGASGGHVSHLFWLISDYSGQKSPLKFNIFFFMLSPACCNLERATRETWLLKIYDVLERRCLGTALWLVLGLSAPLQSHEEDTTTKAARRGNTSSPCERTDTEEDITAQDMAATLLGVSLHSYVFHITFTSKKLLKYVCIMILIFIHRALCIGLR